jgi:hypothetical protein
MAVAQRAHAVAVVFSGLLSSLTELRLWIDAKGTVPSEM